MINDGKRASTHPAKVHVFSRFIENVFEVRVEEIIPGVEKKIGSKILGLRGSIDLLFSYVILEFKVNFIKEFDIGKTNLKKYFQALAEQDPEGKYIGIITDCEKYAIFAAVITNGKVTGIMEIGSTRNISLMDPNEVLLWIDSFLFSKSGVKPTAEDLVLKFGPNSPTYGILKNKLSSLFYLVASDPEVNLKLELWRRNMGIVYGDSPSPEAFIEQTYLVTLAKIIIYLKLTGNRSCTNMQLRDVLSGRFFRSNGIINLIEEDFFVWILQDKISNEILSLISSLLNEASKYNISEIDEDLFKEIYQSIVQRGQRHKIGEYYTPEWISEIILKEAVSTWRKENPGLDSIPKILDPACGSGTLVTNAIRFIRSELSLSKSDLLETILNHVIGMDVNPLAVIIARANYIVTLGDLIRLGKTIFIPVFLADSVKILPVKKTIVGNIEAIEISANEKRLELPLTFATNSFKRNKSLTALREAIYEYDQRKNREYALGIFENKVKDHLTNQEIEVMKLTMDTLLSMIDKDQNSIWIFILNNTYAPILLNDSKVDIVIGNPPWIVMRSMEKEYQEFLKKGVFDYRLLKKTDTHLFTQLEMATYFFVRCADLYLGTNGLISFILPISVLGPAGQHREFQKFSTPLLSITHIFNFEAVSGIFSLPFCVISAIKGRKNEYPVRETRFFGKLAGYRRNERLQVIKASLESKQDRYSPPVEPQRHSHYIKQIKAGASIYPRPFWFIEFNISATLGFDIENLPVVTSSKVLEVVSDEWSKVSLKGEIESEYIFLTLLGKDLIPFGVVGFRPIVLPCKIKQTRFSLYDIGTLRTIGKYHMADWLSKVQNEWEKGRTGKSAVEFPRVLDRLDRYRTLSDQNPSLRYLVLYNSRGANAMAYVLDRGSTPQLPLPLTNEVVLRNRIFVVDVTNYYFGTNNLDEAHYLSAILNSSVSNKNVKPFQPRGQYGKRDIYRRPFMLPIPQFDGKNEIHIKLAKLSKECHDIVSRHRFAKEGFKSRRNEALKILSAKMSEIDIAVIETVR